jgi:predicted DNA-binding protein
VLAAYALFVVVSEELGRLARESEQRLAATAPEISRGAAALLREVMPQLSDERQRQLAKEMARRFESRADARSRPSSI